MKWRILCFAFVFAFAIAASAQNKKLSGMVVDDQGKPLPGATLKLVPGGQVITTATDGAFTVDYPSTAITITVSYIGFKPFQVNLATARSPLTVKLETEGKMLDEVVAVGYGTQRKSDLTGAVSIVKAADLKQTPIVSMDQGLQGRAAGVQVTQNSGAPGGGVSVRVRGNNSVSSSNEPLYVVDGFPISGNAVAATGGGGAGVSGGNISSALTGINPNDIESIEILKDAASTAIYGSRGANGVVLITTKRGKAGKTKVDFESYYGVQKIRKQLKLLNAPQFMQLANELGSKIYPDINAVGEGTDWQEEIFRSAPIENYQLSVSGGNEKTLFNISGNYFNQDGIIINSNFKRGTFRLNFENKISDKVKIGTNTSLSRSFNNSVPTSDPNDGGGVVRMATSAPPTMPVYRPNGTYALYIFNREGLTDYGPTINPVAFAEEVVNKFTSNRILSNIYADINILEGLSYRASFGGDFLIERRDAYTPRTVAQGFNIDGQGGIGTLNNTNLLHESILSYNKKFNEDHNLSATAVFSTQGQVSASSSMTTQSFLSDVLTNNNLNEGATPAISSNKTKWRLDSYTARLNYTFKDRYLLSVVSRVDGSSRFGDNKKYGFFPSVAGAWKISAEPFMQNQELFSNLKLRASYGVTGNADIPLYQSLFRLGTGGGFNYNFNNLRNVGVAALGIANPELQWEYAESYNAGLDIGILKDKVTLTVDAYIKNTTDLLISRAIPSSSGFSSYFGNFGAIENKGLEFFINAKPFNGDFKWDLSANIAFNRNKLTRIDGKTTEIIPVSNGAGNIAGFTNASLLRVGAPVGSFYGYVFEGIYQSAAEIPAGVSARPGSQKFADIFPDGKFSDADRTIIGNPNPDFTYGASSNFSYKNLDLNFFMQGSQGNDIFNLSRLTSESVSGANQLATVLDRWTATNPSNRILGAFPAQRVNQSTLQVEDGSYLRLKNITLGYSLPLDKMNIKWASKVRVYLSGNNVFTVTKYSGYDPEVNTASQSDVTNFGIDNNGYPVSRSFLFGLQLGL